MKMYYAIEVNSLSVYLSSKMAIQSKEISHLTCCTRGKNCLSRVSLNLTATRSNRQLIIEVNYDACYSFPPFLKMVTWTAVWCFLS